MVQKPWSVIRLSLICPCSVHHRDYKGQALYPQSPSCSCLIIDIYCLIEWIWTGINTHLNNEELQWFLSDIITAPLIQDITKRKGPLLLHKYMHGSGGGGGRDFGEGGLRKCFVQREKNRFSVPSLCKIAEFELPPPSRSRIINKCVTVNLFVLFYQCMLSITAWYCRIGCVC